MSETKKWALTLELTDEDLDRFLEKCFQDSTTPAEVLEGFINDLIDGSRTRGSDERMYAEQYYNRCGYGHFFPGEYRSFSQWLLSEYGEDSLIEIIYALDDIKDFEKELENFKENPEEYKDGEIEDIKKEMKESKGRVDQYYREYTENITKPDTLEEGIKGINKCLEMIDRIKKGDVS